MLDDKFQKASHAFGIRKDSARKDPLKLRSDPVCRLRRHKVTTVYYRLLVSFLTAAGHKYRHVRTDPSTVQIVLFLRKLDWHDLPLWTGDAFSVSVVVFAPSRRS